MSEDLDGFFLQDQVPEPTTEDEYYRRAIEELNEAVDAGLMTVEQTNLGPMYRLTDAGRAALEATKAGVLARLTDPSARRRRR